MSDGLNYWGNKPRDKTYGRVKGTPTYTSWRSMLERCKPGSKDHAKYHDRGIAVCERWLDFMNFIEDMGLRPSGTSIDRIDGTKGYEPGNCRWATAHQQNQNRSSVIRQAVNGEMLTLQEAGAKYGLRWHSLIYHLRMGRTMQEGVERMLAAHSDQNVYVVHLGERMTQTEFSRRVGKPLSTVRTQMKRGLTIEQIAARAA